MTVVFNPKRGDTWEFKCVYVDESNNPISLSGISIASDIKTPSGPVSFDVVVDDTGAGEFRLSLQPSVTGGLAPHAYLADVEFTSSGVVRSTDAFILLVLEDLTNARQG